MQNENSESDIFKSGDTLGNYEIVSLIGKGGYGEIYCARDVTDHNLYALKVEKVESKKKALEIESSILIDICRSPYFPKFIRFYRTDEFLYLAMELLGPSISNTRRQVHLHRFKLSTVCRVGIYMIKCIEEFHRRGYLHRDIKPGNFLLKNDPEYPLVLIDYGLSKKYINNETGEPYPERPKSGFRGTSKYASLYVHNYKDMCRRDDLISWLYSMVELYNGKLPWSYAKDNKETKRIKECTTESQLFSGMPPQFIQIWKYLNELTFFDTPEYGILIDTLLLIISNEPENVNRFDWEDVSISSLAKISPKPDLPKGEEMKPITMKRRKTDIEDFYNSPNRNDSQSKCCLII